MSNTKTRKLLDTSFGILGLVSSLIGLSALILLLWDVVADGAARLNIQLFLSYPSRKPEEAGILSAWVGTLWVMILTAVITFPIGVATATYLEEYSKKGKFSEFLEVNINNLAGVPSITYGLLGLELFVRILGLGRSVLAGALTLSLVVLPIVIVSTREAIRAVPNSVREAAYALGADKWQAVRGQVIPSAMPGILSGIVLALSRAIGETAPLITIGALTYVAFLPTSPISMEFPFISLKGLFDAFTVLPIQIFNWVSRPQKGFQENAAAAIIVLLGIALLMNALSIYFRYKYSRKMRW